MDTRDLVQSDLVNFRRRQVGGGPLSYQERVPGLAIGQLGDTDRVACGVQVIVANEIVQALVRGDDLLLDRFTIGRRQARAIFDAEILRHVFYRRVEGAGFDVVGKLRFELRQHFFHQDGRLHDALLRTLPHVHNRLIDDDREIIDTAKEIVVVLHRFERMHAGAAAKLHEGGGDRVELVDRLQFARKPVTGQVHLAAPAEGVVGETVLACKLCRIDGKQSLQVLPVERCRFFDMLRTNGVTYPVVETVITDRCRVQRIQFEHLVEVLLDQCVELGSSLFRCLPCRLVGRLLIAGSKEKKRQNQRGINAAGILFH